MRIAISGTQGLIGSALTLRLIEQGHSIVKLVRTTPERSDEVYWNADLFKLDPEDLDGVEAIIHLAGENIADKKWTPERKKEIISNRKNAASTIRYAVNNMKEKPKVVIFTSAVGYYGTHQAGTLSEDAAKGYGFTTKVCQEIEEQARNITVKDVRVVTPRLGVVLSANGGALKKMIPPFKMGLGGRLGSGEQMMSWIDIEDAIRAFIFCLENDDAVGVINFTSPYAVHNRTFTQELANALGKKAFIPTPAWAIKLLFGEMGEELLLKGVNVYPQKLKMLGFSFKYPSLKKSLEHIFHNKH